jgi:hypothetical protein
MLITEREPERLLNPTVPSTVVRKKPPSARVWNLNRRLCHLRYCADKFPLPRLFEWLAPVLIGLHTLCFGAFAFPAHDEKCLDQKYIFRINPN